VSERPRLRDDLVMVAQTYRGEDTYIVKDPTTHKYFRFSPIELFVMQHFTGDATADEVSASLRAEGIPLSPSAAAGFARKLKQMGLIERSLQEMSVLQLERLRAERHRRRKRTHYTGSVLRMRWSAGDPDALFDRWKPYLEFFFRRPFVILSLLLFATYLLVFATHAGAILHGVAELYTLSFYTPANIVLFWGTAMVVIAIHELGHGVTCKHFGGQVHEMGAMLIYFEPAFFCNVNDAWTFPERSARLWVTAAGSWIQLVVAALAALVWLVVQHDTVVGRMAFFAIIIGGATTVLANANPLIPLDGYYALSDVLEITNLRQRAFAHVAWFLKRHVLRLAVPEPKADARERKILLLYGALSAVYIAVLLGVLAALVLGKVGRTFGAIGVAAVLLLLWAMLRDGIGRGWHAVLSAAREHRAFWRRRGVRRWLLLGGGAVLVLGFVVPWPINVPGRWVAAPEAEAALAPADSGIVVAVYAADGSRVHAGDPIVRLRNLGLDSAALVATRVADSLTGRLAAARAAGRSAEIARLEDAAAAAGVVRDGLERRIANLTLRAPIDGVVLAPRLDERLGHPYAAGVPVARVAVLDSLELRIALQAAGASGVRAGAVARCISDAVPDHRVTARVLDVSAMDAGTAPEARVLVARAAGFRLGEVGEARVRLRTSTIWGALWWAVRIRVRNDLLL